MLLLLAIYIYIVLACITYYGIKCNIANNILIIKLEVFLITLNERKVTQNFKKVNIPVSRWGYKGIGRDKKH